MPAPPVNSLNIGEKPSSKPKVLDSGHLVEGAIELKPLKTVNPRNFEVHPSSNSELLYGAQEEQEAKRFAKANRLFRLYLQKEPGNVWARLDLATNHLLNGDQETALDLLRELREVNCDLCKSRIRRAAVDERWKVLWGDPRFQKIVGPKNTFTDAQQKRKRWMLAAEERIRSIQDLVYEPKKAQKAISHLFTRSAPIRVSYQDDDGIVVRESTKVIKTMSALLNILYDLNLHSGGSDVSCKKSCCSFSPFEHGDASYGDYVIQLAQICTSGAKEEDWRITHLIFWEDSDYP